MMGSNICFIVLIFLYIVYTLLFCFQFPVQHFGQPFVYFKMSFINKV